MDPRTEFEQLLSELCDGAPLTESHRLCVLLREHPEWQADYIDHMQLHALLRWRGGAAGAAVQTSEPATTPAATPKTRRLSGWRRWSLRATAAAMAALAAGLAIVLFAPAPESYAASEVVGQLVDWDLDISQAPSPDARRAIHDAREGEFNTLLVRTQLQPDDKALAVSLIETSSWLIPNDDPLTKAERFGELGDRVLTRLNSLAAARDSAPAMRFAECYQRLADVGVAANLDRAVAIASLDPPRKLRLDHAIARHLKREQRLEDGVSHLPESSQKALHRGFKGLARKQRMQP